MTASGPEENCSVLNSRQMSISTPLIRDADILALFMEAQEFGIS